MPCSLREIFLTNFSKEQGLLIQLTNNMQSVEDFMNEYFRERTVEIEREIQRKSSFRKRFLAEDCIWDSNKGHADVSRSEEIVRVWYSNAKAYVITTRPAGLFSKLRYHLQPNGESWLIRCVEVRCAPACAGPACKACGGTGWTGIGDETEATVPDPEEDPPRFLSGF
jgi:hypothetical protein